MQYKLRERVAWSTTIGCNLSDNVRTFWRWDEQADGYYVEIPSEGVGSYHKALPQS